MKRLILFLLMFLVMGCGICKKVHYVPVQTSKDSVVVERIVRDTVTVTIPGDSIAVVAIDSSHLENRYSMSEAVVDSAGRLHHSLINKNIKIEKEIVYKEVEKKIEVEKEVPVEVEVPVKYIPDYYKWINIIFWCMIGIGLIFVIFKLKKFFHIP